MVCQLWFTYSIVNSSMSAERLFSSWSVLYSGGLRGIEDVIGGANPIALVLLLWFAAEACIIGAIGTLYTVRPTITTKAIGAWPDLLRNTENATYDNNMANDLSQGNLFGAICSPLQRAATMAEPPIVACSPDGTYCRGSATGALHPLIAGSFGIPYYLPFTNITAGDVVEGDVLAATVTISCNSTANFTLWENEAPPDWAKAELFVNVSLPTDSGDWTTITAGTGYGIIYQAPGLPEIGVLPLAATEAGGFMMVLFARDFPDDFRGFQQFRDPIRVRRLGLTLCTTDISVGTAAMETAVVFTTPTVVTQVQKVEIKGPMRGLHIGSNFGLYAVIQAGYYYLNCYYWYCPQTPVVPMFDRQCGLLAQPVVAEQYDYDGQQATAISALTKTIMMQFAAFELLTSADPNNTVSMVPVQVFTKSAASRLAEDKLILEEIPTRNAHVSESADDNLR
ncbi:hypothetical protein HDU89_005577 [Geranomyces variabilis]|nr:hypothetical protein HDU89_005577 [Geranomyces variabilis]